jgi:hypothetical protein
VTFCASANSLPTLEQLFIGAEMALREICTEYNRKTDSSGLDPQFPSDCNSGGLARGNAENRYGDIYASGYKDHLVDCGMYISAAY